MCQINFCYSERLWWIWRDGNVTLEILQIFYFGQTTRSIFVYSHSRRSWRAEKFNEGFDTPLSRKKWIPIGLLRHIVDVRKMSINEPSLYYNSSFIMSICTYLHTPNNKKDIFFFKLINLIRSAIFSCRISRISLQRINLKTLMRDANCEINNEHLHIFK